MNTPSRVARFLKSDSILATFLGASGFVAMGRALNFVSMLILTSALGSSGYGIYALTLAWANMVVFPASIGIPEFVTREMSVDQADGRKGMSVRLRRYIYLVQAIPLAAVLGLFSLLIVTGLISHVNSLGEKYLWLIVLFVPISAFTAVNAAILRAFDLVRASVFVREFIPPVVLVLSLLAVTFSEPEYALGLFIAGHVCGSVIALLILHRVPKIDAPISENWPSKPTEFFRRSMPFMWLAAAFFINQRADILMLGKLGTFEQTGIYQVAAQFSFLVVFPLQLMNGLASPRVAKAFAQNDETKIEQTLFSITAITFSAGLAISVGVLGLLEFFGIHLLGPEFVEVAPVFAVLAIGNLFNLFIGPVGMFLSMARFEKVAARAMAYSAAVNIALNLALIPFLGMYGAAIATTVSMIVWNAILMVQAKRLLGLPSSFALFARKAKEVVNGG